MTDSEKKKLDDLELIPVDESQRNLEDFVRRLETALRTEVVVTCRGHCAAGVLMAAHFYPELRLPVPMPGVPPRVVLHLTKPECHFVVSATVLADEVGVVVTSPLFKEPLRMFGTPTLETTAADTLPPVGKI